MIFNYTDYREFIKELLPERSKERAGYSLRAFSTKLGISNSFLSQVLSNKKSISVELALKIAIKLNLTDAETQYFCLLVQRDQEQDPVYRAELSERMDALNPERNSHDLSKDLFQIIADWYHYGILELTKLSGFTLNVASASIALGISKTEADEAIKRLVRLKLLEVNVYGHYQKSHNYLNFASQTPNAALKQYHEQILQKALHAVHEQTPRERMSATDILPIDSKYIPEVDRLSLEFSNAVMQLADQSKVKDSVYALSVHFFKLNQESAITC